MNDTENAWDKAERCRQTVDQQLQHIVDQQLKDTIPKSIDDTRIQYKTVMSYSSIMPTIKIYLKTSTENNENLCRTFCIPIYIPHVYDVESDILLSYLSDMSKPVIESFLVRLTKGILANDLTGVADNENSIHI